MQPPLYEAFGDPSAFGVLRRSKQGRGYNLMFRRPNGASFDRNLAPFNDPVGDFLDHLFEQKP
jgi:hypothetical protein